MVDIRESEMKNHWDLRYAQKDYVYGTIPNTFIKEQLDDRKPGKILFPAEGEGRNAVYAASLGWDVQAFDSSLEGKKKAEALASEKGVSIRYQLASFEEVDFPENEFDCVALVYAHTTNRRDNHRKLIKFLKPGGVILLEGFSKKQINYQTGGPKSLAMLFSQEELNDDFSTLSELKIWEEETEIVEGHLHKGKAAIIRLIGRK